MGIRFFNLHTIPWCFHLMGNYSCIQLQPLPEPQVEIIKLIKSDGVVKIYDRPIHVSDLMLEFPKHLICRSDSFYIGQKIPALSEQDRLQLGETYFLLPQQFFQSVLSFVTIASLAAASSKLQLSSSPTSLKDSRAAFLKANSCQPFDIQKSPTGCLRIRVSDEFISQLMEQGKFKENEGDGCGGSSAKSKSKVCTTPQLEKDYSKLVGSRLWKPKLEPIKEKEMRKFASFGIQRSKKFSSFSQSNETQKINTGEVSSTNLCSSAYRKTSRSWSEQHLHSTPTTKTCSKIRMRIRSRKP